MSDEREHIGLAISDAEARQAITEGLRAHGFLIASADSPEGEPPQAWIMDHAAFERQIDRITDIPVIVVLQGPLVSEASAVIKRGALDCWLLPYKAGRHGARLEQILGQARMGRLSTGYGLAALLAHEMKSPVIAVLQQVMALEKGIYGSIDPKAETLLNRMHLRLDGLAGLIDEWLILSRALSGEPVVQRQVDLSALVQACVLQAEGMAGMQQVVLEQATAPEIVVSGDARSLKLMVANLVENGIKYSPQQGRVKIMLAVRDRRATLSVRDNGVGISPEYHEKIFDPFFRIHQIDDVEGAGLGLSLVRAVAQAHGGSVSLSSVPGEGSQFTVTLPCHT